MRKALLLVLALMALPAMSSLEVKRNNQRARINNLLPYHEGQIFIKTLHGAPEDVLLGISNAIGAGPIKTYPMIPGLSLYEYDASLDIADVVEAFLDSEYVEYAEPNYIYEAQGLRVNAQADPRFSELWALENSAQTGGAADVDINAEAMWEVEEGSPNVVIGIIDTGIDYTHQDLVENVWNNSSETPGDGIDNDQNGYIDDIHGINAVANTGDPLDDNSHGTHVSGTIGAVSNSIGVVGVAKHVKIAGCKFLDAAGRGAISDAIQCMQYYFNLKTRVVNPVNIVATNNSWGGGSRSQAMADAIKAHQDVGILFIASAGNSAVNNDTVSTYPANYEYSNVISVAATDHNDALASFSNYGKRTVHVGAPGVRILSTVLNQGYAVYSGTSMASPHVSGLVAIINSRFPGLDYRNVKNLVMASGKPIPALANSISGRRIRGFDTNGQGALSCLNQAVNARLAPATTDLTMAVGEELYLSAVRLSCSQPNGPITLYTDARESIILQDNGQAGDRTANDGTYSLLWHPQRAGSYSLDFGNGDTVMVTVSGGNSHGYHFQDAAFEYESITGTRLSARDDSIHSVTIPFAIPFAGNPNGYTRLFISSNGTISFTNNNDPGYQNGNLPSTAATTLVAPFWDDLQPKTSSSDVYAASLGQAPNRKLVVEWRNFKHYSSSQTVKFQAVFYENSSDIRFNYFDAEFSNAAVDYGKSATVGVQTAATDAVVFSFDQANIASQSSLAVHWE